MTLSQYARNSQFSFKDWQHAAKLLDGCGFSKKDSAIVLQVAFKNRLNPKDFARAAIELRSQVNSGLPLNRYTW